MFGEGQVDLQDPESGLDSTKYGSVGEGGSQKTTAKKKAKPSFKEDDDDDDDVSERPQGDDDDLQSTGDSTTTSTYNNPFVCLFSCCGNHDPEDDKGDEGLSNAALAAKPHVPSQNACLWLFHCLQGIAIVASLCLVTTQILPLALTLAHSEENDNPSEFWTRVGITSLFLKLYISVFCILLLMVEAYDWISPCLVPKFIRQSPLLQRFFSRGFLYSFLGLIGAEDAYSEQVKQAVTEGHSAVHIKWAAVFMQISSWLYLAIGILYMLLGICCLQNLRDRMKDRERQEWKRYKIAMKEWKDLYR